MTHATTKKKHIPVLREDNNTVVFVQNGVRTRMQYGKYVGRATFYTNTTVLLSSLRTRNMLLFCRRMCHQLLLASNCILSTSIKTGISFQLVAIATFCFA